MASTMRPVVKAVYLCDEVLPDAVSQKISLLNAFGAVRLPDGALFPYTLGRICVFAQMEDGEGDAEFRVVVVSAATGEVVFGSAAHRVFIPNRLTVFSINIRLRRCRFPAAGEYWVELHCDGEVIGDRVLRIIG